MEQSAHIDKINCINCQANYFGETQWEVSDPNVHRIVDHRLEFSDARLIWYSSTKSLFFTRDAEEPEKWLSNDSLICILSSRQALGTGKVEQGQQAHTPSKIEIICD